jgi:PKD repeat protein/outer membrane protein assembly factor BamB
MILMIVASSLKEMIEMKSNVIAHAHIKRKAILGIMLALFLTSMLASAFNLLTVIGQTPLWTYPTGSTGIRDVMVSADGSLVVTGTADGNIHGIKNGFVQWKYLTGDWILSADMSDDGGRVVAGSDDGNFYVLDGNTGTLLFKYLIGSRFFGVDVTPNGQYFAAGCSDDNVYFFSVAGPLWTKTLGNFAQGVSISNDGSYVAAAGTFDQTTYFFDRDGNLLWSRIAGDVIWEVQTSGEGNYVAFGSKDKNVYFYDKNGNLLWEYATVNQVQPVTISTDEQYVVAGTGDYLSGGSGRYYIYLFDRTEGFLWDYEASGTIHDVAISPDSTYVVAASHDNNIYFLDTRDGALIWKYNTGNPVYSVSISSDGNYIAAGSDSEVFLFNAPPAQMQLTIEVVGSGTTNPAPGTHTYDEGSAVSVDAQPDPNWRLDHWLLDGSNVGADDPYTVTMDASHTLKAVFVPIQHELTIEVVGSGTTNPAPGTHTYDEGSAVSVDAQPDPNWRLDHWLLDGSNVGADDPYTVTIDTIHVLRAVFVEVLQPEPPVASFTFSPSAPKVGETVNFDASASMDPDGTITSYAWNFGDGNTGTGKTTSHAYEAVARYTVTLTVTDNDGLTDTDTKGFDVYAGEPNGDDGTPPVADSGNDQTVEAGTTVTFNGGGSSDNEGIASYEWNFGDGTTGTGVVATHTYTKEGTYTVTLTVTDAAGNSDKDTIKITVGEASAREAAAPFPLWILAPVIGGITGVTAVFV